MREEIAYQEMQAEQARERQGQPRAADAGEAPEEEEGAAAHGGAPDPTRKERAYPDLPGEGKPR